MRNTRQKTVVSICPVIELIRGGRGREREGGETEGGEGGRERARQREREGSSGKHEKCTPEDVKGAGIPILTASVRSKEVPSGSQGSRILVKGQECTSKGRLPGDAK